MRHILNWFRLRKLEKELDRELGYHLDRRVTELEAQIQRTESEITEITTQLEDPGLYAARDGVSTAKSLGVRLDSLKAELDALLAEWGEATEVLETLTGQGA